MCADRAKTGWDFTPVLDLINSLSSGSESLQQTESFSRECLEASSDAIPLVERLNTKSGLGNFDKLWRYLGQPLDVPSPGVGSLIEFSSTVNPSNGLDATQARIKGVKWRDEVEGTDLTETDTLENGTNIATLSKSQRRKERRIKREEGALEIISAKTLPSGSENESEGDKRDVKHSPDRKSIIQRMLYGPPQKLEKSSRGASGLVEKSRAQNGHKSRPLLSPRPLRGSLSAIFSSERTEYATAAEKKSTLMDKLYSKFIDERRFLSSIGVSPQVSSSDTNIETNIHVFVDASNIMIGFHDALKVSRGITTRIRRQPLSFHNLSLILERGRPTTKKVLVGSDNFPAIQEAKMIGYETNILERVHKAKELTPRKKYNNTSNQNETPGQSSGSETAVAIYAPEKWVEQAVDEILHLKILESIVDAKTPETIVLATGDAAEAEYSQGFLKMVERALEKGWKVELVSFKHNTSRAYMRKDFRSKWGRNFKIVELDEFVEELLSA